MKLSTFLPFFATLASTAAAIDLKPDDEASIKAVTRQYAYGLMSLYKNNATGTAAQSIGIWPAPHYWWEAGATWGGMIEYSMFTGDDSHVKTLQQALVGNYGKNNDFILEYMRSQTGNDDQAFWGLAVMSALEYQFPNPDKTPATYLEVAENTFKNIIGRWDDASCGGGLKWQIYPENAYGYNYKNSISTGSAFSLASRLARYTGKKEYADWASKLYDWTAKVGLISEKFEVFDGVDDKTNCVKVADKTEWTYNNAMFLHGSAYMFDYTKGDNVWKDRTAGFLKRAETLFFNPMQESNNIMYEAACETGETGRHCNLDQQSFKAYLARFMAKTAIMAPFTKDNITKLLKASAAGAALSCSGGADKSTCGSKWYTGNWDGTSGVGQQLSALEVTQALLTIKRNIMPAKKDAAPPQPKPSSTPAASPAPVSSSQANVPSPSSQAPAPASSSKAPVPASSSKDPAPSVAPPTSSTMKSVQPAAPSVAPVSSGGGASSSTASATLVKPSVSTKISPPAHSSPGANLGGVFGEKNSTSTSCTTTTTVYVQPSSSCTPSTTVTVYVPPKSQIASSGAPVLATSSGIMPPANSSVPKPTQPLEFIGAAGQVGATVGSIMGAAIVAMVAVML